MFATVPARELVTLSGLGTFTAKSANFTALAAEKGAVYLCTNTIAATLPAASGNTKLWYRIVNGGSGLVNVALAGVRLLPGERHHRRQRRDQLDRHRRQPELSRRPSAASARVLPRRGRRVLRHRARRLVTPTTDGTETPTLSYNSGWPSHYRLKWLGTGGGSSQRWLQKAFVPGTDAFSVTALGVRMNGPVVNFESFYLQVEQDSNNLVHLAHVFDASGPFIQSRRKLAGVNTTSNIWVPRTHVVGLHIQGNNGSPRSWSLYYSVDPEYRMWEFAEFFSHDITVATVSLFFGMYGSTRPQYQGVDAVRFNWMTL